MATETLPTPAIIGGSKKTKVYKNFIDGEWVDCSTGMWSASSRNRPGPT
jgi:hypothetical protein